MRACRLRGSNTRPPRYEGGALPSSELSRRKETNGQRRRSEIEATLQQGLRLRAERSAAGQFWTFTMSNSKALVEDASRKFTLRGRLFCAPRLLRHARALVRTPACARRTMRALGIAVPIARHPAGRRACSCARAHGRRHCSLELVAGHCGSLLPVGGGMRPAAG